MDERERDRLQLELLRVLHGDGDAHTRRNDGGAVQRLLASAVPFVIGLLVGVLGTLNTFTAKLSSLEAKQDQQGETIRGHTAAIQATEQTSARTLETVARLDTYVRTVIPNRR